MAAPASFSLRLYEGDDYELRVTFQETADGVPIDKSASTFAAHIRTVADSEEPLAEFTVDDTEADEGVILLTLPGDEVIRRLNGARWDLQETADGHVSTKLRGPVSVREDITR